MHVDIYGMMRENMLGTSKAQLKAAWNNFDVERMIKEYTIAVDDRYNHHNVAEKDIDFLDGEVVSRKIAIRESIEQAVNVICLFDKEYSERYEFLKKSLERAFLLYEVSVMDKYSADADFFFEDNYERKVYWNKSILDILFEIYYKLEDILKEYEG